jgi:hypothetical protein
MHRMDENLHWDGPILSILFIHVKNFLAVDGISL